jgi:hypothetical protein
VLRAMIEMCHVIHFFRQNISIRKVRFGRALRDLCIKSSVFISMAYDLDIFFLESKGDHALPNFQGGCGTGTSDVPA